MTKKMEKIIETYKEKLETAKWLYENGHYDFNEFQEETLKECCRLETMITTMFHYNLLSEKDFTEVTNIPFRKRCEITESVM